LFPVNFALARGGRLFGGPKERASNLVDELEGARRDGQRREVLDSLGGDHRFNQGGTARCSD
jgi:hypothetical protein